MKQEATKNKVVTINGKRGEYTGFSNKTVKHHFSMYDGSTVALSELETVRLFGVDFVTPTHTYNQPKDESKEVKEGGELFTGGEWKLHESEFWYQIHSDTPFAIAQIEKKYRFPEHTKANALLLSQSKNMYYALKAIVDNWDQHMIGDKEQLKKNIEHDIEYWSPSASMINSEHIANARKILLKATPKK